MGAGSNSIAKMGLLNLEAPDLRDLLYERAREKIITFCSNYPSNNRRGTPVFFGETDICPFCKKSHRLYYESFSEISAQIYFKKIRQKTSCINNEP
jgi:hypothetical protein